MPLLFIDVRSAFYSIVLELVLTSVFFPKSLTRTASEHVCQTAGLGLDERRLGFQEHLTRVLIDWHKHNWLAVEGLRKLASRQARDTAR